jgi:hypothetical protein
MISRMKIRAGVNRMLFGINPFSVWVVHGKLGMMQKYQFPFF